MSFAKMPAHGHVTKDINLKKSPQGHSFCRFQLAVDRYQGPSKEPATDYINYIAWRTTAETMASYVKQGAELIVEGQFTSYQRQIEGEQYPRTIVEFEVLSFDFCGKKSDASGQGSAAAKAPAAAPAPAAQSQPQSAALPSNTDFEDINGEDGDLPF